MSTEFWRKRASTHAVQVGCDCTRTRTQQQQYDFCKQGHMLSVDSIQFVKGKENDTTFDVVFAGQSGRNFCINT